MKQITNNNSTQSNLILVWYPGPFPLEKGYTYITNKRSKMHHIQHNYYNYILLIFLFIYVNIAKRLKHLN